jgi:hypothetical protein
LSTLTDKTLEVELVLPTTSIALAVMFVIAFSAKVILLLKFPLSSAMVSPNKVKPLNNFITVPASALPIMVMVVLLVMLSLLLMPVSSVVTNAKFSGAIGAILSNFWVNGMAAILTRFEVALATTSAAISTVMLPSVSVVFGVTIKVKTLL